MSPKPSTRNKHKNKSRNFIKHLKDHPIIWLIGLAAAVIGTTWQICIEVKVKPRDFVIEQLEKKLAHEEDEIRQLRENLKGLRNANSDMKNVLKIPDVDKIEYLDVSRILYQAPDAEAPITITHEQTVQTRGKIWFEIRVPEPGGYLLAFLEDSAGDRFNLFPGTRNAVVNGYYRIPEHLLNPRTEAQKLAAQNAGLFQLASNTVMIGGYTFDETKGEETFHFYYMEKRNTFFEDIVGSAQDIGKDVTLLKSTKGVETTLSGFEHGDVNKVIDKPIFYRNTLKLRFKHDW